MGHKLWIILWIVFLGQVNILAQSKPVYKGMLQYPELDSLLGSIEADTVLINFWATWCGPCIEELPQIESFSKEHPQVKILLISLDFKNQLTTKLLPFIETKSIQQDVYLLSDPNVNSWIPKIDKKWSGSIPATLVISEGSRFFYEGVFTSITEIEKFTKIGEL